MTKREPLSTERPLLLASGSPRRHEILAQLGLPCVVRPSAADESLRPRESASAYVERIVDEKAKASRRALDEPIGRSCPVALVADTVVVCDEQILGKPETAPRAAAMVKTLAGRRHDVMTRFALVERSGAIVHVETVVTSVRFRALSEEAILAYAETGEGFDKAGGYAVQGRGAGFVAHIEGSYTNVVGLPASEVVVALEQLGLMP